MHKLALLLVFLYGCGETDDRFRFVPCVNNRLTVEVGNNQPRELLELSVPPGGTCEIEAHAEDDAAVQVLARVVEDMEDLPGAFAMRMTEFSLTLNEPSWPAVVFDNDRPMMLVRMRNRGGYAVTRQVVVQTYMPADETPRALSAETYEFRGSF